jgi:G patch domain-containing protein 1
VGFSRTQKVEDFYDEDELEDMRKSGLQVRAEYDTFGTTAAERARLAAQAEMRGRDRAHLNFVPDVIVVPVADSMGAQPRLLSSSLSLQIV